MGVVSATTTLTLPSVVYDMDERTYHADPVPGGSLSSTGARRILDSPARFQWEQTHRTESVAFDVGHALHTKVLGVGSPAICYPDEHLTPSGNPSTKATAVAWAAEMRAAGFVILGASELARVDAMAEAILAHPTARALLEQDGRAEASVFATDPETGVNVRARFDYLAPIAVDVKTTFGSASREGFGSSAAKYGYPIQESHYLSALAWATGERPPMQFVVVEKAAPHLVAVHAFDEATRLAADELAAQARRTYADCLSTDTWPAYGEDVITTTLPGWWWARLDDEQDLEMTL